MNKVYSLSGLESQIKKEKSRGKRIVLANGCFDLIHVGHIRYLREARSFGDILVVALNSDRSVQNLKGPGRPLLEQKERALLLSALEMVNYITVFDENTVHRVLKALQPHVHAKGSDYTVETVPERETVKNYGGETVIVGGDKVRSASEVIRDISGGLPPSFLLIRLSSLGDIIHTLPAFSALREKKSGAEITWLVEEKGRQILELVPGIDRIESARLKQFSWYSPKFFQELFRLRKQLSQRNQTAFDFQGLIKSGIFAGISRSEKRCGFHPRNLREPGARIFYTQTLDRLPEFIHVIDKNLKLLTLTGVEESRYRFPFRFPEKLMESLSRKLASAGYKTEQSLIIFNIGAAWKTKQWPEKRWIKVIQDWGNEKYFPLILWGNRQEKDKARTIAENSPGILSPYLNLQEVLALLNKASLTVSGDTFALQAACALDSPAVALFGPTHPGRNGPFRKRDRVIHHPLDCSYCYKRKCPDMTCMKKITVEEVRNAVKEMMKRHA